MELEEFSGTVALINDDVSAIIEGQRILGEVHEELAENATRPFEPDFIVQDATGVSVGEPFEDVVDGVRITKRILHQRGRALRDIKGADLLYEVQGHKYALIQYKTPDRSGRVHSDEDQLRRLTANCPTGCPVQSHYWPYCGSWYCVRSLGEAHYLQACEADAIFGGAASRRHTSFRVGLTRHTFDELFALCWIGAPVAMTDVAAVVWSRAEAGYLEFLVTQRGLFR